MLLKIGERKATYYILKASGAWRGRTGQPLTNPCVAGILSLEPAIAKENRPMRTSSRLLISLLVALVLTACAKHAACTDPRRSDTRRHGAGNRSRP